jgi:hypothetical protein
MNWSNAVKKSQPVVLEYCPGEVLETGQSNGFLKTGSTKRGDQSHKCDDQKFPEIGQTHCPLNPCWRNFGRCILEGWIAERKAE